MVKHLTNHLGKIAGLGRKVIKFKRRDPAQRTWAEAKKYFRGAIEGLEDEKRGYGIEAGLEAIAAVAASQQQAEAEQKAREDIANQMSGPFNALANATIAKAETLDTNASAIKSLTESVAKLTATNKRLVAQLAEALTM